MRQKSQARGWRGATLNGLNECSHGIRRHFVIRRTCRMAFEHGAPCPPAGRDWSWRCRWRLRQSFDDDGGAATSSKSEWLIVDGSAMRELWCASLEERSHSLSYTSGGHDSCSRRRGRSVGHLLSRRASLRAFVVPDVVSTHGLTRCFALIFAVGQGFFDRTLRFVSKYARDLANTVLIALARSAQSTGIYAWHLDALVRIGALTILSS